MQSIGFTFDEKILKHMSAEHFFEAMPDFDAIEIAPDPVLNQIVNFKHIVSLTKQHHYHVPYFIAPGKYDFSNEYHQRDYTKLLSIIESLRQFCVKTPSMIIHGSQITNNYETALDKTRFGLDFLLNFVERKHMDLNLCLETIPSTNIGDRTTISQLIHEFKHPNLTACLDLHHDQTTADAEESFYDIVTYLHIHHHHDDIKKLEHIPKLNGHYNIELLMSHCSNYKDCLIDNIQYLNHYLKGQ